MMPVRRAFTLVEILVAMGIIVILISLLVVAAGGARTGAMRSTTDMRLDALAQAVSRFEQDTGYLPPLLDNDRAGVQGLEPTRIMDGQFPKYLAIMQGRYSYTSPAEYLLGYGTVDEDGVDGYGMRHPGEDGWWNASFNDDGELGRPELADRRPDLGVVSGNVDTHRGQVIGPYLEVDDPSMVASLGWDASAGTWDGSIDPATGQPVAYQPGTEGYHRNAPKVIVDAWGTPIRYYRINHPPGNPGGRYRADYQPVQSDDGSASPWTYSPSLSEYFALRSWEFDDGQAADYWFIDASGNRWGDFSNPDSGPPFGDPTTGASLQAGRFAFLSGGADRRIYDWARVDQPGEAHASLTNWLGDHSVGGSENWYEDGQALTWFGRPRSGQVVAATEEANRDNIIEVGK